MESILIFNSEDNYNSNLGFKIGIKDKFHIFKSPKITIWNVLDEYIQIDVLMKETLDISKLETLIDIIDTPIIHLEVYPNLKEDNKFFKAKAISKDIFKNNKELNDEIICFSFYCELPLQLTFKDDIFNDFRQSYTELSQDVYLSESEINFVNKIMEIQEKDHYFNDQNLLIETEYNRIRNIKNKRILKKKKTSNFDPSMLKVINGPLDPMKTLNEVTGLNNVKKEIEKLKSTLVYREKRENNGDKIKYEDNLHMCFYGNPGTGKTTIARIMTGLLYEMGYIKENKCIEINGLELKGSNVGQTSIITKGVVDCAKGGVLFIDEAYTLNDENDENFGKEAVNVFLKEMEDNRGEVVLIFAGYREPMEKLLDYNSGFRSRIKKYFDFEDYNTVELCEILISSLKDKHLYITQEALKECIVIIKNAQRKKGFGNGRYIRNLIETLEENHILNVKNEDDMRRIDTITIDDVSELSDM